MIAIKNTSDGEVISKEVVEVLQDVVRNSSNLHPLVVSRAAFYLLHVLRANYVSYPCCDVQVMLTYSGSIFHTCAGHSPHHLES